MLPADKLPASLRAVKWTYEGFGGGGPCSLQPLLKLSYLGGLSVKFSDRSLPSTEELRQLASLQQLKAVGCEDNNAAATLAAGIVQVWNVLPLTCLVLKGFQH
jgi:hypothetical protein